MIKNFDFIRRLFVIVLAILQPFIIYFYCGELQSLSQSWTTDLQFLFILTNALVSYFFFDLDEWKIPSMFLLLLTAFSVPDHFWLHNIFAILFFLSCLVPLYLTKRFKYYFYIYLISIFFWVFKGFFWMETWGILTLCVYHLHLMLYKVHLLSRHSSNSF
jgi:hypothetical protein